MIGLLDVATIYTETASTGTFTTVAKAGLKCRLRHMAGTAPSTAGRQEQLAMRVLIWTPEYEMPEQCQVEVGGVRWNPVSGTFGRFRGPNGMVHYRSADVVRATNG